MDSDWKSQWESMSVDDLFALREQMQEVLSNRLRAQKAELERRLQILNHQSNDDGPAKSRPP